MNISHGWRRLTKLIFCANLIGWMAVSGAAALDKPNAERILSDKKILEVEITLPDADWEGLRNESRDMAQGFGSQGENPFTYRQGDLLIDGLEIENVGVRKKGLFGSQDIEAPSLLVDFNRFVDQNPVKGLGRLTLNNNKQDQSLLSQYLCYKIFRDSGIAAPRVGFARVTVNGEYLGVYSNVESVKNSFLKAAFGNSDGTLYEGTITDLIPETIGNLEIEGDADEVTQARLKELAEMLAATEPLDVQRLEELVDVDHFLTYWAVEGLLGFWDGYSANQNNYFVYASSADGKFRLIPWGADGALGTMPAFGGGFGGGGGPVPVLYAQGALANRLYFAPGMANRYRDAMNKVLDQAWNEEQLLAEVDRLEDLLAPHLAPRQGNAAQTTQTLRAFIRDRRQTIEQAFQNWPVEAPATYRLPMTTVELGRAEGSFATTFRQPAAPNAPPVEAGGSDTIELQLNIDGEEAELRNVAVMVSSFSFPGFPGGAPGPFGPANPGAPGRGPARGPAPGPPPGPGAPFGMMGEPPISLTITGTNAESKLVTLNIMLDRRAVREGAESIPANGMFTEGAGGFGPFGGGMKMIAGTVELTERGIEPGEAFAGAFKLKISEMRGGFMNSAPLQKPTE